MQEYILERMSRVFVTTAKIVVWLETEWSQSLFRSMQRQVDSSRERGKYDFKPLLMLNIKVYFVKTFGCDR